jgi:hypothetical protein
MAEISIHEAALLAAGGGRRMEGNCGAAHGEVCAEIKNLKSSDTRQWAEITGMKKLLLTSLGAIIVTMLGVIVNLAVTIAKTGAVHP